MQKTADQARLQLTSEALRRLSRSADGKYCSLSELFATSDDDLSIIKQSRMKGWQRLTMHRAVEMSLCKMKKDNRRGTFLYAANDRKYLDLFIQYISADDTSGVKYLLYPDDYAMPAWFHEELQPTVEPSEETEEVPASPSSTEVEPLPTIAIGLKPAPRMVEIVEMTLRTLQNLDDVLQRMDGGQMLIENRLGALEVAVAKAVGKDGSLISSMETKVGIMSSAVGSMREVVAKVSSDMNALRSESTGISARIDAVLGVLKVIKLRVSVLDIITNLQRVRGQMDVWSRVFAGISGQEKNIAAGIDIIMEEVGKLEDRYGGKDERDDS